MDTIPKIGCKRKISGCRVLSGIGSTEIVKQTENTRVTTVNKDWLGPANNDLISDSWLSIADTRKLRYKELINEYSKNSKFNRVRLKWCTKGTKNN